MYCSNLMWSKNLCKKQIRSEEARGVNWRFREFLKPYKENGLWREISAAMELHIPIEPEFQNLNYFL